LKRVARINQGTENGEVNDPVFFLPFVDRQPSFFLYSTPKVNCYQFQLEPSKPDGLHTEREKQVVPNFQSVFMKAIIPSEVATELRVRLAQVDAGLQIVLMASSDEVLPEMNDAEIFLYHYSLRPDIIPRVIRAVPALRWIHSVSAGVDHLLCRELVESSIVFTNSAGAHAPSIAESVMGMLLFVVKHLGEHWDAQKVHRWQRTQKNELCGKTMGIIGLGHVGLELARRAKAFGMRVVATKQHPNSVPGVDRVWGPEGLSHLLGEADYVVMCAALTEETRGMIGEAELRQMKATAYFVNTARGALVLEEPLLRALRKRRIAGACLDVFIQEPLPPENPFWDLPNVFITPHNSAGTPQVMGRALDIFVENLRRYREGEKLMNVVDKKGGY
jgi:phosphoglycerate dehydrogenase-like enzyme